MMEIAQWILSGLLTLAFVFSAFGKLRGHQMQVDSFTHLQLPQWFRPFTGLIQLIAASLLIAGFFVSSLTFVGSLTLSIVMLGAVIFHLRVGDSIAKYAPAIVLCGLSALLAYLSYSSLLKRSH